VQTQLNEDLSDSLSSSDSCNDDDDNMPQLSPVTDVFTSFVDTPPSTVHTFTSLVTSALQTGCTIKKPVSTKSSTRDISRTELYCVCRTPYDKTKYITAAFCHNFELFGFVVTVTFRMMLTDLYCTCIVLSCIVQ